MPYENDCFVTSANLGVSNWEKTKQFVSQIITESGFSLSNEEWEKVKIIAIEKSRQKSPEEFLEELSCNNPGIMALSDYRGNDTKILFECLSCGNKWETFPGLVLLGHGCPKCGKKRGADYKRKSNEQFLIELKELQPDVTVLGEYYDNKTKLLCQCNICDNVWEAYPQNLLRGQGCKIYGRKKDRIIIKGSYVDSSKKIEVICKKCKYDWFANPSDLLGGHGGPKCAGSIKRTNEQFVAELTELFPNIIPLEEYKNANAKISVKCLNCNYEWMTRPHDLLRSKGCPECRKNNNNR